MKKQLFKFNTTKTAVACGILAASLSFGTSALAFSDLSGNPAESKINALQAEGVINGITHDLFAPKSKVTYAQGIQLLVNAFDLQLNNKQSKASVYFTQVADKAWYSQAFLIAQQNGLSVDKMVNPTDPMTRAQFAHLVHQALMTKGNFPVTLMYINISDGEKLSPDVSNSLQALLNMRLITLSDDGKFRPNEAITRSEAAVLIYDATEFVKKIVPVKEVVTPTKSYEGIVALEKAAVGVNKVSLTVDNLPNSGYTTSINRIEFGKDLTATLYFNINQPDPGQMNLQVISKSTAVTYVPSNYKVVAKYEASSVIVTDPFSLLLPYGEGPTTPIKNPEDLIAK
ncbi:S-layer homology domain-containing protein [Paenibacillus macquariensis]|uniref:S-layer homology domain-containing protein n=1 Tax=Paenibacillus macquariensis TaxID=948756 RepID=A0ABY1KD25_9BACL|nr:S-layer homology domain-containing protein [Paenibacillus macquariensis]MEC0093175.1 S-layer homology domain-containing protein [Paenibacillus macquariensis]OAB35076.1 hypothetical protein PMSM_10870 [Paenibacillus macquariensis subsp. macquariensis]SIR62445.1 S-layer homology domain-containing protein [Paenibacillus macquariensis]